MTFEIESAIIIVMKNGKKHILGGLCMTNLKRIKDKKGFTLVELLVVLIILVILAAILIPSLTRYIDESRRTAIMGEARSVLDAAQVKAHEWYGKNDTFLSSDGYVSTNTTAGKEFREEVLYLANVPDSGNLGELSFYVSTMNMHTLSYSRGKYTAYYEADTDGASGTWTLT